MKAAQRKWREQNRERKRAYDREYMRTYEYPDPVARETYRKEYNRQYRQKHAVKIAAYQKEYRLRPDRIEVDKRRKQSPEYKEWQANYDKQKYGTLDYRLKQSLRSRTYHALKNNQKVGSAIDDLGCTVDELKQHLETQFQDGSVPFGTEYHN